MRNVIRFDSADDPPSPHLTCHARRRMQGRAIPPAAVEAALDYGRVVHTRGAVVHAIGRNEIAYFAAVGTDLSDFDGVQVVCALDGSVVTVYRNRDFRGLRTGLGRGRPRKVRRHARRAA
jgi:hypothetical protein